MDRRWRKVWFDLVELVSFCDFIIFEVERVRVYRRVEFGIDVVLSFFDILMLGSYRRFYEIYGYNK